VLLAACGCAVALYLGLYQLGVTSSVWDPLFGRGSEAILTSSLARAIPVPDALLGALVYGADAVLALLGDEERWRTWPWVVALQGFVLLGLVLTGVFLVFAQLVLFHTGCTLCLASALISFASGWLAHDEVLAALHQLRR